MFEFLLELSEMNTLSAIYTGIILGLTIKYIWFWNTDCPTSASFSNYNEENKDSPQLGFKKFRSHSNVLFNWIIQIVRRKEASSDDIDCSVTL
jgi:hypothetical protein